MVIYKTMKVISYSLFKGPDPLAELFYVRGLYFNVLMNSLVYPGWNTVVFFDDYIGNKYRDLFINLVDEKGVDTYGDGLNADAAHCKRMLLRMKPIFFENTTHVICRDADALTSKREAEAVDRWTQGNSVIHGIHDNPAHSIPLMGGLSGFKSQYIREKYGSFENLLLRAKRPIAGHGTDQHLLNDVIHRDFMCSFSGVYMDAIQKKHGSDLCTSFIGAAGCNEMETLRFFRDHLPEWGSDQELWKQYPKLFYWHD